MIDWVKEAIERYLRFTNILEFDVLTGLRPAEAIESFKLLLDHKKRRDS